VRRRISKGSFPAREKRTAEQVREQKKLEADQAKAEGARVRAQQSMIRKQGQRRVEDDEGGLFGEAKADMFDAPAQALQPAEAPSSEFGSRWDAMNEAERTAIAMRAGWAVQKGDRLNPTGRSIVSRPWADQAEGTRATLERFSAQPAAPEGPAKASDLNAENGTRAYGNMSFSPERRAQSDIAEYVRDVNELHVAMMERAETPEQRAVVEAEIARYREGYITRQNMLWAASARTASPMITGPANFPAARNRKALDAYDKKIKDFTDWQKKAKKSIRSKVDAARTGDQVASAEWDALRRDIAGSIAEIRNIDAGTSRSDRGAFTDSIKRKIETRARRGETDVVRQALDMVREAQAGMAKPIFAERNAIWSLGEQAAQTAAAPVETGESVIAEYDGARIVDNKDDSRVRIYFDAKPSADVVSDLKKSGWRWSRSEGAWQRQNTNAARSSAQSIVGRHFEASAPDADSPMFSRREQSDRTPFYSGVLRGVEAIQQEKGNGLQWLAMIRKQPGVKAEEIDWLGLPQWLLRPQGHHQGRTRRVHPRQSGAGRGDGIWRP
jgi:hypothetical protein